MSSETPHRPRWEPKRWLVGLILAVFVTSTWVVLDRGRPQAESSADLELIVAVLWSNVPPSLAGIRAQGFDLRGPTDFAEIRTRIGDERFLRAIKEGIRGRPADWEAGLLTWLPGKGRIPAGLQVVMDGDLSPLVKLWGPRAERLNTALTVIKRGPQEFARLVLPELIDLAGSRHLQYALNGIRVLQALGEQATPALPVLFRQLEREDSFHPSIAEAIHAIDPAGDRSIPRFLELLPKSTARQRAAILPILGAHASRHPELATNFWPLLRHPDQNVLLGAIRGLGRAGLLTPAYLEPHRSGFHSTNADTRWLSLNLVAHAGADAAGFVPELRAVGLLKGPGQNIALSVLTTVLFSKGPPTGQRFAAAEAILASDSAHEAIFAMHLVQDFGSGWPQVVTLIEGALANPDAEVRSEAANQLGQLGPAARPALPKLRALRQDGSKRVRDAVELALPKIGE